MKRPVITKLIISQWPAALYGLCLFAGLILSTFDRSPPGGGICLPSEANVAACIRGWLAPLSSAISSAIALCALFIALRQSRIARNQQRSSFYKDRLVKINELYELVFRVNGGFYMTTQTLHQICQMHLMKGINIDRFLQAGAEQIRLLDDERLKLRPLCRDAALDFDLKDIASEVVEISDLNRLPSTRNLADAIARSQLIYIDVDVRTYIDAGQTDALEINLRLRILQDELGRKGNEIKCEMQKMILE